MATAEIIEVEARDVSAPQLGGLQFSDVALGDSRGHAVAVHPAGVPHGLPAACYDLPISGHDSPHFSQRMGSCVFRATATPIGSRRPSQGEEVLSRSLAKRNLDEGEVVLSGSRGTLITEVILDPELGRPPEQQEVAIRVASKHLRVLNAASGRRRPSVQPSQSSSRVMRRRARWLKGGPATNP
jgi:hypothetical protein